jgi:hypothetical protein
MDCVIATQKPRSHGYPTTSRGKGTCYLVHRLAWEDAYGEIPAGMEIHHECENKLCVNVDHMRLITRREHNLITHGKERCVHGHAKTRGAPCRECARLHQQRRRDARAAS